MPFSEENIKTIVTHQTALRARVASLTDDMDLISEAVQQGVVEALNICDRESSLSDQDIITCMDATAICKVAYEQNRARKQAFAPHSALNFAFITSADCDPETLYRNTEIQQRMQQKGHTHLMIYEMLLEGNTTEDILEKHPITPRQLCNILVNIWLEHHLMTAPLPVPRPRAG